MRWRMHLTRRRHFAEVRFNELRLLRLIDRAEARYLFKTILHIFRTVLQFTRQGESPQPQPDGEMLGKFFEHSLRCLAIFETNRDPREPKEVIELLSQILLLFEPHVFSEVWSSRMSFFVEQAINDMHVFPVLQMLITHESVSHPLVGILLKYLMSHLDELGSLEKGRAALIFRLFKISFLAINTYIAVNEVVLVPQLQNLITNSFAFAAKTKDPSIYYQILRALFRYVKLQRQSSMTELYRQINRWRPLRSSLQGGPANTTGDARHTRIPLGACYRRPPT